MKVYAVVIDYYLDSVSVEKLFFNKEDADKYLEFRKNDHQTKYFEVFEVIEMTVEGNQL